MNPSPGAARGDRFGEREPEGNGPEWACYRPALCALCLVQLPSASCMNPNRCQRFRCGAPRTKLEPRVSVPRLLASNTSGVGPAEYDSHFAINGSSCFLVRAMGLRPADHARLRQLSARTLGLGSR